MYPTVTRWVVKYSFSLWHNKVTFEIITSFHNKMNAVGEISTFYPFLKAETNDHLRSVSHWVESEVFGVCRRRNGLMKKQSRSFRKWCSGESGKSGFLASGRIRAIKGTSCSLELAETGPNWHSCRVIERFRVTQLSHELHQSNAQKHHNFC